MPRYSGLLLGGRGYVQNVMAQHSVRQEVFSTETNPWNAQAKFQVRWTAQPMPVWRIRPTAPNVLTGSMLWHSGPGPALAQWRWKHCRRYAVALIQHKQKLTINYKVKYRVKAKVKAKIKTPQSEMSLLGPPNPAAS